MVTFVLVDDSENIRNRVKNIINKVMFDKDAEYNIHEFSNLTNDLKELIDDKSPKIFILDIELENGASGLDIGKYIRAKDWDSELIYITSHDKMFEKVFRTVYKVFDFIEKFDSMEKRLESDLRKIFTKKWDKKKFTYSNNRIKFEIFFDDIYYIYRDTIERKAVIKTGNGNTFLVNKNIADIFKELDGRFKQVHRSCIVNTDKVNLYNYAKGYFILDNNERVDMLSKKYKIEND